MPDVPRRKPRSVPADKAPRLPRPRPPVGDELRSIPGIGPAMARDLRDLGIHRVAQLRHRDPEQLYRRLGAIRGETQDRCVLYVFRCAVYFATAARPQADRLLWWNWKDRA